MSTSFLLISDPLICAKPVEECHEPLVDMREYDVEISSNRAAFYDGFTLVRESVANRLVSAMNYLPTGWRFLFSEGHRPIELQTRMYTEYYDLLAQRHPEWNPDKLNNEATKYIASPHDVPPHSTGGAIDITLLDAEGNELDMGSTLDDLPDNNENRNFTYATNISASAQANRAILINALLKSGFVNYPAEWWHWSYGDKYWAYHAEQPHAIYGSI